MEEGGEINGESGDERWIVDPIDGTTNFLHGIPISQSRLASSVTVI